MRFLRLSCLILLTEGLIKGPDFKLETEFLSPEAIDEFLENLDHRKGSMTHILFVISMTHCGKFFVPSKVQIITTKNTKMITWLPSKSLTKELPMIIMNMLSSNVE